MSEISDLLRSKAQTMEQASSEIGNEWQMIKSATISSLEAKGVSGIEAKGLLEKLAERAYPNLESDTMKATELLATSKLFEKVAEYVNELEVKLSIKEDEIEGLNKAANIATKAPSVDALSGTGAFTSEDLETLSQLSDSTLSKVAGLTDKTPWNLGGPSDRVSGGQDALAEFLLS